MQYYGIGNTKAEAIADCIRNIERDDWDLIYRVDKIEAVENSDGTWHARYDSSKY